MAPPSRRALRPVRRASRPAAWKAPTSSSGVERVRAELDNLRAAFGWALDSTPTADAQLGLRIVAALAYAAIVDMTSGVGIWATRRGTPGRRDDARAAHRDPGHRGDPGHLRRRPRTAETLALDALRDGLPPDCPGPAPAYSALASMELDSGRPDEALRVLCERARRPGRRPAARVFKIERVPLQGVVFSTYCGDVTTARAEADEALRLARQIGNPSATASALNSTGVALIRADPPAALAALEAYIVHGPSRCEDRQLGLALGDVGWLKARAGDRVGALRAARDGIRHDHTGNRATFGGR